jgi:hypothetical protein
MDIIPSKTRVFLSLLYCSPFITRRTVSCQMVIMPGRWLLPPPRSPLLVSCPIIGYPTGGRPTILYGLKSIYLQLCPQKTLKNTGALLGARSCAWWSVPQSATGLRRPNPAERKNPNSSVAGVAAPGDLASISSEAADSRRNAPTAVVLAGISPTPGTSRATRNDQPSPEGGARPPPLGAIAITAPAPSGRGRRPKAGRGGGSRLQLVTALL